MNFFSKKKDKPEAKVPADTQSAPQEQRPEVPRKKRDPRILNSTQLQRVKDAKRLAETKLQGLDESLSRVQSQHQWLRRYNETHMLLEREKKHLFELGKQRAGMAKEADMLERYDLFENIHGTFQKLTVLTELIEHDKRGLSELEREADSNRHTIAEQEKRQQQAADQEKSTQTAFLNIHDNICTAYRLKGNSEALEAGLSFLLTIYNNVKEELEALSSMIAEKQGTVDRLSTAIERLYAKRQSIDMHENMLQHAEATQLRLNLLLETALRRDELKQMLQKAVKRQEEENELLGKAFAQYQELISQIDTIEAELGMHRAYIHGQNSFSLQERAMMLKSRRQMLLSALSLWKRISSGYGSIEEKSRRVTDLRLHIRHLEDAIRSLGSETDKVLRLTKEKEYTYLLSKGQDVIRLRADLREGVSCSVCGATHHPYHSDTMLEQSKLISQMKTDYELLASEAQAKQQQLMALQLELATSQGELRSEEEALNAFRIRQKEDTQEWQLYAQLDTTFANCDESTNIEARTVTLRQLIENVSRDAEYAQKELETFTFHQSSIAQLSEKLQKLEQQKNEISVRLNELNTGCQVLSREVERIGDLLDATNKRFTSVYESVQFVVTIKDWYSLWQKNPEVLNEQIQTLADEWLGVNNEIAEKERLRETEETKLDGLQTRQNIYQRFLAVIVGRKEDVGVRRAENDKALRQAIEGNDMKSVYLKHIQALLDARRLLEEQREAMDATRRRTDVIQGRHDFYLANIAKLEAAKRTLQEKLDLWMHGFNQHNPPVRFGELQEVFADGTDWSRIRNSIKQIANETLLCQAKVDDLNGRIIALEMEDGRCSTNDVDIQEHIAVKQHTLIAQRNETLMHIARLALQLEGHEKGLAAERNSAEPQNEADA